MRDRRNAFIWAVGMWLVRRTLRKRGAAAEPRRRGVWIKRLVKLAVLAGIVSAAVVAWRRFAVAQTPQA